MTIAVFILGGSPGSPLIGQVSVQYLTTLI